VLHKISAFDTECMAVKQASQCKHCRMSSFAVCANASSDSAKATMNKNGRAYCTVLHKLSDFDAERMAVK